MEDFFRRHLRTGDVVADVGANLGFFSVLAARLVGPTGQVISFEPNPDMAQLVRLHARANGLSNIQVEPYALSDCNDKAQFYICGFNVAKSSLSSTNAGHGHSLEVHVRRLDDVLSGQLNFVKIDVEGAEAHVLRGARRLLREQRPIVVCEIVPGQLLGMGATVADALSMFPPAEWKQERIDALNMAFLPL